MPIFLKNRNPNLIEWMDREDCDKELLFNTYRQFERINKLLSGWNRIYNSFIRPTIVKSNSNSDQPFTILDIGCGGGDIIRYLNTLCTKDGFHVLFTGIDPDTRALEYSNQSSQQDNVLFFSERSDQLVKENRTFDIVISNHLIHHLSPNELTAICNDASALAKTSVIFSDIERSDLGYLAFQTFAPLLFKNSYIVEDGLTSIKKCYRKVELLQQLPVGWTVVRKFPFRLLALYSRESL
jgi:2-polyprenyl-3-methyl-5-hydroxy-6-metoxy-1,4-benzoquinol methylase